MTGLAKELTGELESLWRFALRLTQDEADAEDLVQRTCVKALESEQGYEARERLRSWLFRIEHRLWLNTLRSRKTRAVHKQSFVVTNSSGSENASAPESTLQAQQILNAVDALPDTQRVVVLLICVEGLSYEEAAGVLEVPKGTIMSRLSRARGVLVKGSESLPAAIGTETTRLIGDSIKPVPELQGGV